MSSLKLALVCVCGWHKNNRISIRQNKMQRSSLLVGGQNQCRMLAIEQVFGRTSILGGWWFGVDQMIIRFSKAFIPPSIRSSIQPFLQIVLG